MAVLHRRSTLALTALVLCVFVPGEQSGAQIQFERPQFIRTIFESESVVIHDVNQDGLNDIVVGPDANVYINRGNGRFVLAWSNSAIGGTSLVVGDIDGDDAVDFAWTHSGTQARIEWWSSQSDRIQRLGVPVREIVLADFDGDSDLDLAGADNWRYQQVALLRLFENIEGVLTQVQTIQLPGNYNIGLTARDLNGDGWTDLAIASNDTEDGEWGFNTDEAYVVSYENDGRGRFSLASTLILGLRLNWIAGVQTSGDFDNDGDLDLIVGLDSQSIGYGRCDLLVLANEGTGREFVERARIEELAGGTDVDAADFDMDGRLDFAAKNGTDLLVVRSMGQMRFELAAGFRMRERQPGKIFVGDLTGNGLPDFAILVRDESVSWCRNITLYDGPRLWQTNFVRGREATIAVRGAEPGEVVHFLFSLEGEGNSVGQPLLGGMTLDLLQPILYVGSARADAEGRAALIVNVPPDAPPGTVTTQAVIRRGPNGRDSVKTPFHTAPIQD